MFDRLLWRLGAACGILFVVLVTLGWEVLGGGGGPDTGASPEQIGAYYSSLPAPGVIDWIAMSLVALGLLCLMVFVVYLSSVLRRAEGEDGWLSTVALGGGLLTVVAQLGGFAPGFVALLIRMHEKLDPQVAAALYYLNDGSHSLVWITTPFLLAPVAIIAIRTRVLPRWLGWFAAVLAVGLPLNVPLAVYGLLPPVFLLLYLVWIVAASVVLMRKVGAPRQIQRDKQVGPVAPVG